VVRKIAMPGQPILRRSDDAAALLGRQRPGGVLGGLAPLHLDEGGPLASGRHEIDLADRRLVAPGDDAVTLEAKQKRGDGLGKQSVAIGF
jgi:hypothetical protein